MKHSLAGKALNSHQKYHHNNSSQALCVFQQLSIFLFHARLFPLRKLSLLMDLSVFGIDELRMQSRKCRDVPNVALKVKI